MTDSHSAPRIIEPDWPAPPGVRAFSTTRIGGHSTGEFAALNLGLGRDEDDAVLANRDAVAEAAGLDASPRWLRQVHGARCVDAHDASTEPPEADACVARGPGAACVIMTADCLPVVFAADDGSRVGCAHAGWRGLAGGVLESTIDALALPPGRLVAWLGPCIGPRVYEVGPEVREAFVERAAEDADAFEANRPGHWLADLPALARARLARAGVTRVHGGDWCTYSQAETFYSYRRDGSTGRMATYAWIAS